MFTGLVEKVGTIRQIRPNGTGKVFQIEIGELASDAQLGDSIAVNGVCLTVTAIAGTLGSFDVSGETLACSTASNLTVGSKVNLERAMSANGRFGGHIVQGHVDGVAKLKSVEQKGDFYDVSFEASNDVLSGLVPKGSISVNGISLTVARMDKSSFTVAIIPVTWKETNLSLLSKGEKVNIETDLVVKVIQRQLENMLGGNNAGSMSIEKLRQMGF